MKRSRFLALALATTAFFPLALVCASAADAAPPVLPTGGRVTAGTAAIGAAAGGSLTIDQSSAKAIINWTSFSIGQGGTVRFDNGAGATLNRVTGASLSSLDGLLSATGSVYLLNPNGVIIGKSGVVSVGGTFVVSTLDLANSAFLAGGDLTFSGPSTASVINLGKVGSLGGDVALIATTVDNDGSISAPNGTAGLVAGSTVAYRDAALDGGKFEVLVGGASTSVTNAGLVEAANAELRAEQGNIYALAGDTAGVIRATGVKTGQGKVWLVADQGTLDLGGTLEAKGANGAAGAVETSGETVNIGGIDVDAHSGTWTIDPDDLLIDAAAGAAISRALNAGTNVSESTSASGTSGVGVVYTTLPVTDQPAQGDIGIEGPISWSSTATLTISSYHSLYVYAPVTVSGAGGLNISWNTGGATGANAGVLTGSGGLGSVSFTGVSGGQPTGSLSLNGQGYVLVRDLATLSSDIAANNSGFYALAVDVDGSNNYAGYSSSPLASTLSTPFQGTLEGLGHAITGLTINDASDTNVGLFGQIGSSGVVRDLFLNNQYSGDGQSADYEGSVQGTVSANVGALAGSNAGTLINVSTEIGVTGGVAGGVAGVNIGAIQSGSSTATVTGSPGAASVVTIGGLVGVNQGTITGSEATGMVQASSVNAVVGGLAGSNTNSIIGSDAAGIISNSANGGAIGGLVGANSGPLSDDSAGGGVSGQAAGSGGLAIGGLAGTNSATITGSNAEAGVAAGAGAFVGGLVGQNLTTGSISTSYMLSDAGYYSSPTGGAGSDVGGLVGYNQGSAMDSYAAAIVEGGGAGKVGGLVGVNAGGASITNTYATGSVTGMGGDVVGGLVGSNAGTISSAWSAGAVATGSGGSAGGFAGANSGSITAAYYDQGTTGQTIGVAGTADASSGVSGFADSAAGAVSTYGALQFGTTPGGTTGQVWVIVDADGSLNNAGGAAGGTRPFLLSEYSTTITNSHQLQLMALNLAAQYTGGKQVDATDTGEVDSSSATTFGAATMWTAQGFIPIGGNGAASFTGSLAGDGVDLLTIANAGDANVGLFGVIGAGASVAFSVDGTVSGGAGATAVGILAGSNAGSLTQAEGSGLAGSATDPTAIVGGLVGVNTGTIANSHSDTAVRYGAVNGGLVGDNQAGSISGSYANGSVTLAKEAAGGLVGSNEASISTSYAVGSVSGATDGSGGTAVGGLAGLNGPGGAITTSYATGAVGGGENVGGLVGDNKASITQSYATGAVTGAGGGNVGGLVGLNESNVADAYATGAVSGASGDQVGGFVGDNTGSIATAYSTGLVIPQASASPAALGAFAGASSDTITASYWDSQTSGISGVGVGVSTGSTTITPLTTAQFMNPASFTGTGWSFGGLGSGAQWVVIDADGTIDGANGATRPFLLSEYSTSVTSAHQLQLMILDPTASYTLGSVDAAFTDGSTYPSQMWSAAGFIPVGSPSAPFTGTIADGSISGLTVAANGSYVGLVGYLGATGTIEQAYVENESVSGAGYVGGLVGDDFGTLYTVSTSGSVSGPSGVGGLAGVAEGGSVATSAESGDQVTGSGNDVGGLFGANFGAIVDGEAFGAVASPGAHVGGLVGYNSGPVNDSSAAALVNGGSYVGGLIGLNYGAVQQSGSYANVTGVEWVGGLVGWNAGGAIGTTFSQGPVTATGASGDNDYSYVGGLVGVNQGSISGSIALDTVSGTKVVGGLVGLNEGSITNSAEDFYSNTSSATGNLYVGGLAGWNNAGATISSSYATGAVTGNTGGQDQFGNDYVGGLVGVNFGSIANAYATGAVSGVQVVGGLVGTNMPGGASVTNAYATGPVSVSQYIGGSTFGVQAGTVTDVYGFPGLSGQSTESGYVTTGATGDGTDLTSGQQDGSAAYSGFDFTHTWQSNTSGPPTLDDASYPPM